MLKINYDKYCKPLIIVRHKFNLLTFCLISLKLIVINMSVNDSGYLSVVKIVKIIGR